jgi:hypothetical protein
MSQEKCYVSNIKVILSGAEHLLKAFVQLKGLFVRWSHVIVRFTPYINLITFGSSCGAVSCALREIFLASACPGRVPGKLAENGLKVIERRLGHALEFCLIRHVAGTSSRPIAAVATDRTVARQD